MPKFGATSLAHRADLHPDLQKILDAVIECVDCSIVDGVRTTEEQRKNVAKGVSKTMASLHLPCPQCGKSHAVDVMPFPYDWAKIQRGLDAVAAADPSLSVFEVYWFIGFFAGIARGKFNINLRQGADWNSNQQVNDQQFVDLPHNELRAGTCPSN